MKTARQQEAAMMKQFSDLKEMLGHATSSVKRPVPPLEDVDGDDLMQSPLKSTGH